MFYLLVTLSVSFNVLFLVLYDPSDKIAHNKLKKDYRELETKHFKLLKQHQKVSTNKTKREEDDKLVKQLKAQGYPDSLISQVLAKR